jgi:hypothetical protein
MPKINLGTYVEYGKFDLTHKCRSKKTVSGKKCKKIDTELFKLYFLFLKKIHSIVHLFLIKISTIFFNTLQEL